LKQAKKMRQRLKKQAGLVLVILLIFTGRAFACGGDSGHCGCSGKTVEVDSPEHTCAGSCVCGLSKGLADHPTAQGTTTLPSTPKI